MKIGLDFDKTVFNTVGFIEEMPVEPDLFKRTFEQAYLTGKYSVSKHAESLAEEGVEVDESQIREVFNAAPKYLSTTPLQGVGAEHELYLVTRADAKGWQQKKIQAAGAEPYFRDIFIVYGDHRKDVPELDVLVDDNPDELIGVSEETRLYDSSKGLEDVLADFL